MTLRGALQEEVTRGGGREDITENEPKTEGESVWGGIVGDVFPPKSAVDTNGLFNMHDRLDVGEDTYEQELPFSLFFSSTDIYAGSI